MRNSKMKNLIIIFLKVYLLLPFCMFLSIFMLYKCINFVSDQIKIKYYPILNILKYYFSEIRNFSKFKLINLKSSKEILNFFENKTKFGPEFPDI